MSVIDEIKDRIDIVDLVSESVELRRAGRNYTGFCPFHHNVNTPSFVVFPDTQTWKCFGECDEGGDAFSYVMKDATPQRQIESLYRMNAVLESV